MPFPSSILLLHGLGGSGSGSVRLLEERLRAGGWNDPVYLRPTLQSVRQPAEDKPLERVFVQSWNEMNGFLGSRVPHLTLGFSFGGLLAAFAPSPLRLSVCAPWSALPPEAIQRASARRDWRVLQGGLDTVVIPGPNLDALPAHIPRTVDAEGTHDFDAWMDRVADWTLSCWDSFRRS
jgi:hypothetical protein